MANLKHIKRPLGKNGPLVNALGLGCMGMSDFYGDVDDEESIRVLNRSIDLGINFWDTSDIYGPFKNEILLSNVLKTRRSEVFLCTKFGIVRDETTGAFKGVNSKPEYVLQCCANSLKRLGVDYIDLYYQHRVDPNTPIEETMAALVQLQKEGKIRHIGLSECSAHTLRRAYKVAPVAAVQIEYSPWTLDIEENGLLDACKELGVSIVAYSPLGRGFLTGAIKSPNDFDASDFRRHNPRFQGENFNKNLVLVDKINEIAKKKGCTNSQLVLAWVLAQGELFLTIPGTKRVKYLEENSGALGVEITKEDDQSIREVIKQIQIQGTRYDANSLKMLNI